MNTQLLQTSQYASEAGSMYNGGYLHLVQEPHFSVGQVFNMMTMVMRILWWWKGDGDALI